MAFMNMHTYRVYLSNNALRENITPKRSKFGIRLGNEFN